MSVMRNDAMLIVFLYSKHDIKHIFRPYYINLFYLLTWAKKIVLCQYLLFFVLFSNFKNRLFYSVTETHQIAQAQQEKNAKLREAFGISEYFVDGSSFDPARETKEQMARANALREQEKLKDLEQSKKYDLVHTPSPEPQTEKKKTKKRKSKNRYYLFFKIA